MTKNEKPPANNLNILQHLEIINLFQTSKKIIKWYNFEKGSLFYLWIIIHISFLSFFLSNKNNLTVLVETNIVSLFSETLTT